MKLRDLECSLFAQRVMSCAFHKGAAVGDWGYIGIFTFFPHVFLLFNVH